MKRANTFIATLLVWMIVSPSLGLLIDTEASGSIVTSITSDSGDFISSNELHVRDSTNIRLVYLPYRLHSIKDTSPTQES